MKKNLIKRHSGFTLVEMLAVITILAILGGFGFGTYMLVNKQAKVKQTEVMIENLSAALETRSSQTKTSYPNGDGGDSSTNELYAYLSGDYDNNGKVDEDEQPAFAEIDPEYDGKGKYVNSERLIIDPWRKPMRYKYDDSGDTLLNNNVENGFDLWSAGPDGEFDTEDDINNW